MNAQSLWAGHEYAWIPQKQKGQTKSFSVRRVRLISMTKRRLYGNQNATTLVSFEVLDWDGVPNPEPAIQSGIPAREIVDFWDSHWSENEEYYEGRKARIMEEAAQKRARQMEDATILAALDARGIPREHVTFPPNNSRLVYIERAQLMEWLGVTKVTLSEAMNA